MKNVSGKSLSRHLVIISSSSDSVIECEAICYVKVCLIKKAALQKPGGHVSLVIFSEEWEDYWRWREVVVNNTCC